MFDSLFNKEKVNSGIVVYYIAMFISPFIALVGLTLLMENLMEIMDIIKITSTQMYNIFIGEVILFGITWVALFMSYMLHKFGIKYAQILIALFAFGYLVMNAYFSVTTYASIADIINPVILLTASIYGIIAPLPEKTVANRKKRLKNTFKITKKSTKKK